jgi:cation transport ATPase
VLTVEPFTESELLRLAGAVEQGSGHLLARTVVQEAVERGVAIPQAENITEAPGEGVSGEVDGRSVTVGGWSFVINQNPAAEAVLRTLRNQSPGAGLRAYVAVDRAGAGLIAYADRLRPEVGGLIAKLRRLGVSRILLLSGDDQANASAVAEAVGIQEAHGDLLPHEKVAYVQSLMKTGERVLMVGDGTNDAPALSTATVGIALAAGGGGISAEAADAVILADDPTRVAEAVTISRSTLRIARQSIWVGLGLSGAAMVVASFGYIPPVMGALLQEVIDVAVILNALRAAFAGPLSSGGDSARDPTVF